MTTRQFGGVMSEQRIFSAMGGPLPAIADDRPLIICDVDEVVLGFVAGLDLWLGQQGLWLARDSFALNGNIRQQNGNAVDTDEVRRLLHGFFGDCAHDLAPIEGAVETLEIFEEHATVVFLSNLPETSAEARRANLDRLGLTQPLIVNEGPKGPALVSLSEGLEFASVFLDDSPSNITSALEDAPHMEVIHFVADDAFRGQISPATGVKLFTGDWNDVARYISAEILTSGLENP